MAKSKWNEETIIKRILLLNQLGEDLTCSNVKQIDSALVGAAISYFKNWGAALEAAGLDYIEIRKVSKKRRSEKIRKWSVDKVLDDIREVAKTEEDLSYAYMKEKHSSLVAAASNYIGSWKKALELIDLDYSEVLRKGRKRRIEREKTWYKSLLLERFAKMHTLDEKFVKETEPKFHDMLIQYFVDWRGVVKALKILQLDKETKGS